MKQVTLAVASVLAVAFVILPTTTAIVCTEDICSRVRCRNDMTEESCAAEELTYVKDGGFCGCCPACIAVLKTGERCSSLNVEGVPPTVICEDGAICREGICVKEAAVLAEPQAQTTK